MKLKRDFLDAAFSDFIRWRDHWVCRRCQTAYAPPTASYQCAHIFTRGCPSIRWEPDNAVGLCAGCHMWGTQHPEKFKDWCTAILGAHHMDKLRYKYYARGTKLTPPEKRLLAADFRAKVEKLKAQARGVTWTSANPNASTR